MARDTGQASDPEPFFGEKSLKHDVLTGALCIAAENNDMPTCKAIISTAPEVLAMYDSRYAIRAAASKGYAEIVAYLCTAVQQHRGPRAGERALNEACALLLDLNI
jgi:hypothetical protein